MSQQHAHTRDSELAVENQQGQKQEQHDQGGAENVDWLGNFMITHYTIAIESDPLYANTPKVSAPGLNPAEKYRQGFLGYQGVKMEGSGRAENGKEINYEPSSGRYGYGIAGAAGKPRDWQTIAVDPRVIPYHSQVLIEHYKDKGSFEANDTGGAIKGNHIDVFAGAITVHQANALGTLHSRVGIVGKKQAATPQQGGGGGGDGGGGQRRGNGGGGGAGEQTGAQRQAGGNNASAGGGAHRGQTMVFTNAPTLESVKQGKAVVKKGHQGEVVKLIQTKVRAPNDGYFGPLTEEAVMRWQSENGLAADGEVGKLSITVILGLPAPGKEPPQQHGQSGGGGGDQGGGSQQQHPKHEQPNGPVHKPEEHASGKGPEQMSKLLSVARNHRHPGGWCYASVKEYITRAGGYGNIHNVYTDARFAGKQMYAHEFADEVNTGPSKFGLENLGCASPYDAPAGSIVVVSAGSPGTHNPTAGDITVSGGDGTFYNDGLMGYAGPRAWPPRRGRVLGVYKPI